MATVAASASLPVCVHRFEEVGEDQVAFKMINENATKVMEMLDEIRKQKK